MNDNERVARLLHSKISEPIKAAFTREQLMRSDDGFSNTCGEADGCSLDRAVTLDLNDLRARSAAQAALKEGRAAQGAIIADVSALRSIPCEGDPMGRAVYVYDDPMLTNGEHAIMRVSSYVSRSKFQIVRKAILAAFRDVVAQKG